MDARYRYIPENKGFKLKYGNTASNTNPLGLSIAQLMEINRQNNRAMMSLPIFLRAMSLSLCKKESPQ